MTFRQSFEGLSTTTAERIERYLEKLSEDLTGAAPSSPYDLYLIFNKPSNTNSRETLKSGTVPLNGNQIIIPKHADEKAYPLALILHLSSFLVCTHLGLTYYLTVSLN